MTLPLATCSTCSKPLVWTSAGTLVCPRVGCPGHHPGPLDQKAAA